MYAHVSLKYRQRIFLLRAYWFLNDFDLNPVEKNFPNKGTMSEFTIYCLIYLRFFEDENELKISSNE